jgi:hypothetical protein
MMTTLEQSHSELQDIQTRLRGIADELSEQMPAVALALNGIADANLAFVVALIERELPDSAEATAVESVDDIPDDDVLDLAEIFRLPDDAQ